MRRMPPVAPGLGRTFVFSAQRPTMVTSFDTLKNGETCSPSTSAIVAPSLAAVTAASIVFTCVASTAPSASARSTMMAFAGGYAPPQSPTGTHAVSPSAGRVAPLHAACGTTATHPHPLGSFAKPAAHVVVPTGTHAVDPTAARVPGPQSSVVVISESSGAAASDRKSVV